MCRHEMEMDRCCFNVSAGLQLSYSKITSLYNPHNQRVQLEFKPKPRTVNRSSNLFEPDATDTTSITTTNEMSKDTTEASPECTISDSNILSRYTPPTTTCPINRMIHLETLRSCSLTGPPWMSTHLTFPSCWRYDR